MKKLLIISLMTLTIGIVASANSGKENIYNGKAKGFKGNIKIAADFEKNKIASLNILEHSETPDIGGKALEKLAVSSIGKEISEIDTVVGATYTSKGLKLALENALTSKNN
ncbi:FMN-binding protein [Ilyobacter polytropus]|uniref:FMN-binding domain protein n=1 Tax=Ilyobacter polytropus (strain ATCC 51220 / DSM 2926 / LMG 16218 / CuHBu1) TaxID=572544 RepID=E3HDY9_ILYPC|nr:FMN-binding protein [Ilyobacter polytropus]ADO84601.1 FMN-binding domain protein [Ilyobacter polytropus DSM 2926]